MITITLDKDEVDLIRKWLTYAGIWKPGELDAHSRLAAKLYEANKKAETPIKESRPTYDEEGNPFR